MKVIVHDQVKTEPFDVLGHQWELCFQRCTWKMEDGQGDVDGYRFMWRKDGKLQTARGQARIHDARQLIDLLEQAAAEGWFHDPRLSFCRA